MTSPTVLVSREGPVAILTLNRPEALNALSRELRGALAQALRDAQADDDVRAIVLTGAGERAFTAGLDLKELGSAQGGVFDAVSFDPNANPVAAMAECTKPIIGAINGLAVTGGMELALACDILICSDNARFADTHAKVEVMPGWGLSQRLSRLIGVSRAKEMSLTGTFIDAGTALAWGLVNRVVPLAELQAQAVAIGLAIAANAPAMVARYKAVIDTGLAMTLGDALAYEQALASQYNGEISAAEIEGRREAVRSSNRASKNSEG
jgi:enoyl-CoA hydratase